MLTWINLLGRPRTLKRLVAGLVAASLVAGAPGFPAWQAAAQTVGRGAAPVRVSVGIAPSAPSATLAPALLAPALGAPSAALSVAPAAPLSVPAAVAASALAPVVPVVVADRAASRGVAANAAAARGRDARAAAALEAVAAAAAAKSDKPAETESSSARALFDGEAARAEAAPVSPAAGYESRGLRRFLSLPRNALAKGLAIAGLSVALIAASPNQALGQQPPAVNPPAAVQPADTVQKALPRPVVAEASFSRQGMTVGERLTVTLTLKNTGGSAVTITGLREALAESFPSDLEIQGRGAEAPLRLEPGQSATVTYEVIPFGSGTLTLDGGVAVVRVEQVEAFPEGIEIVLPKTDLEVKTVLTPDWKEKGLRDIVGPQRAEGPNWAWLAAIPLGILLLIGVERLIAARRLYPKLPVDRVTVIARTQAEFERLEREAADLDAASFHARYQDLLTSFFVDYAGLPKAARDAAALRRDLLKKSPYEPGQIDAAARLAAEAETARFSGAGATEGDRRRALAKLKALIDSVLPEPANEANKDGSGRSLPAVLAMLPAAAGLQFGAPWALLLLIPFAAYLWWTYLGPGRSRGERFALSAAEHAAAPKSLRQRFAGLPKALRLAAVGLLIVALGRPMLGVQRSETVVPSTDTVMSIDLSGSMSGEKLEAVRDAVKAYVEEQRRGTQNRVGMVTFSDNAYLDVRLTTDYDALIAHLKELETSGSTAVGKSMLTAIAHFAELNALALDAAKDERIATMQKLLRDQGLPAALSYAKDHPDLMEMIIQPEKTKIVVVFTDGESNSGIPPLEAAELAAKLKVKIYTVGIADRSGYGFDERTLRGVAEKTGAKYFRAGDAESMRAVLLEISRLEKHPAVIVSSVSVKDYTTLLALLAFLMLGAELLLANTRLRSLYGLAFVLGLGGLNLPAPTAPGLSPAPIVAAQAAIPSTREVPAELLEGNRLYNSGQYAEALKKYAEALERHPDIPELYFNMADAYLRLGQPEKAEAAWQKYLSLTPDPKQQSRALFNLGNAALMGQDAEKAIELYKEALRRDSSNEDAKWNLEFIKKAQEEQQQNQQNQQQDGKKGKQGKQKGKPGEGKPGDQQGQPGEGQPGEGKPGEGKPGEGKPGDQQGQGKPGEGKPGEGKSPGEELGDKLGEQEGAEKDAARKGMTRKGSGVWGVAALPFAFAGQGIVFSAGAWLWIAGIGLPILALLIAWGVKKRLDAAKKLSPGTAPKTFSSWWGARRFLGKTALVMAAASLLGLSVADPRGGQTDERLNFGGKDIVVSVDGSHSMIYAEDGRSERTQKELADFVARLQGTDRIGLVVFAGSARTASPLSIDYGNFEFKINRLDVEARGLREGSNLAAGVAHAAKHFTVAKKIGERQRIVIVISDGDVDQAEVDKAVASAQEHGVTVYAIGVGDPAGTKIKLPTVDGEGTEYLVDSKTGAPAVTRLNEAPLRQLAERTGGAYFRGDGKVSIDKVLEQVSRLEQGEKSDAIKSPRPLASYFLWPALVLLLLDLLLPGRSLLRRGAPAARPEEKKGAAKAAPKNGAGMLALALIPIGAWPQILPFALLITALAGYLAVDAWMGGALTRSIKEAWQRRVGFVSKGVASDLVHLYDLREADERRLRAFVKGWNEAKDEELRRALIKLAAADEALWREKLTAAYLASSAPETSDAVLAALKKTARARLEPVAPVVSRLESRRDQLAWLGHSDARERLAGLRAAADGQPSPLLAPAAPAPVSRAKRWGWATVLALALALTGASTIGTVKFAEQQRIAAETSLRLFYAEDLFVFTDRYSDARIPEEVLPALRRWHESPKTAGGDFERALTILRESTDPKADNLIVAIFRRAGVLPLTPKAETELLHALVQRDSDVLWASMDELIVASRQDPAAAQMLVKVAILAAQDGDEKAVLQVFRVLKSPQPAVQRAAAAALYGRMSSGDFFDMLGKAQAKHAADPALQLWTARFAFTRAAEPLNAAEASALRGFLDKALVNSAAFDAAFRPQVYQAAQPGEEVEAPSLTVALIGLAGQAAANSAGDTKVTGAARYLVNKATTKLIQDAEARIPGLHERLIKDGVVLPDETTDYGRGGYDDYDDYHGHGRYYGGGSYTTKKYRETYKLAHLRALSAAIAELGGAKQAGNGDKPDLALAELLDRAAQQGEASLGAGAAAGMLEGGSVAERAAEDLHALFKAGSVFSGKSFVALLSENGLAPAVGADHTTHGLPESLDAAALDQVVELLLGMAKSGSAWDLTGASRPLTWAEKVFIARALDEVAAVKRARFPEAAAPAPADAEAELFASLTRPGEEGLALARLSRALESRAKDHAFALKIETALLERLAAGGHSSEDAAMVFGKVMAAVRGTPSEAAAVAAASAALKTPAAATLAPVLRAEALSSARKVGEEAEKHFSGLKSAFIAAGLRETEYAWRGEFSLRHYAALRETIEAAAKGKTLTAPQAAALESARKSLPQLAALAEAAGARRGDGHGELAADAVNPALKGGYQAFPGAVFNEKLRAAGLMPPGASHNLSDYDQDYSKAELTALRDWLWTLADSGMGWNADGTPRPLSWNEKEAVARALAAAEAALAKHYPGAQAAATPRALDQIALARALDARPKDAAFALETMRRSLAALEKRPAGAEDAMGVILRALDASRDKPQEAEILRLLAAAVSGPHKAALGEKAAQAAGLLVLALADAAEDAFDMADALERAGLRENSWSWRSQFKLRHYDALGRAIAAAAVQARAGGKSLDAEQAEVASRAARVLPLIRALGAAAGVPAGDEPGAVAADKVNPALQNGYQVFPGSEFNEALRALNLMPQGGSNGLGDYKQSYERGELLALRDWLKLTLSQGWPDLSGTRRQLETDEKTAVEEALKAVEEAIAAFPAPASSGKKFHGFAAGPALAFAALPAFPVWALGAMALAGIAWLIWAFLKTRPEAEILAEETPREGVPAATAARHARLELAAKRMATAVAGGLFRSRFIGAGGTDFAESRPYAGEDRRDIDWKTSAKKGELYSKKFELERDMPLMLVVDISRSGAFGTRGALKRSVIEDAAAVIALAAAHSNIRVGAVLVSDRVEAVIPPKGGARHAHQLMDAVINAEASGTGTDLVPGLQTAGKVLGSRAMVVVLSDFLAPDFKNALAALAHRHDLRAVRVSDPAELGALPDAGLVPVAHAETGATGLLDTSSSRVRAETAAAIARREAALEAAFDAARARPITLSTEADPLEELERHFHPKAKSSPTP